MVFELFRTINAIRHTARYLVEGRDHRISHFGETLAGARRYDRKRGETRMRGLVGLFVWMRRSSPRHPRHRG